MEILEYIHLGCRGNKLAIIQLHSKEPKETSINLVLKNISLLSTQSPYLLNYNGMAHLPHLPSILGTEEELSAFREPLEFNASAIHIQPTKLFPESLSNVHAPAHCSQDERQPLGWEGLPRLPNG